MLDWGDFPYFLALVRARTLTAAARTLGVNQSTLGRRLAALEGAAGARLFDRTPDGYQLTASGRTKLESVQSLEENILGLERRLVGDEARVEGRVRIAVSDSFATGFLVSRLAGLRSRHPKLIIETVIGNHPHDLSRREAEIAIRITPRPKQPNLVVHRAGETAMAAYASDEYVARRGDAGFSPGLRGHDVVVYGNTFAQLGARWLRETAANATPVLVSGSLLAAAAAVAAGIGIGLLPCYLGESDPRLRLIGAGEEEIRDIWLAVHSDLRRKGSVRVVINYLREVIDRDRAVLSGTRPRARVELEGR